MQNAMFANKKLVTIGWHLAAWMLVFSLPYLLHIVYEDNRLSNAETSGFFLLGLGTALFWVFTFYLNVFVLIPKLIAKKQLLLYILVTLVLYTVILLGHREMFKAFVVNKEFKMGFAALFNAPAFLLSLASSTIYHFVLEKNAAEQIAQQKQAENLKTELSFLRSQISPHFIFNVLNNIVALARLKSDNLEPTVLKLSSLMQYMLYDTNEERVLLKTEIDYLHSYIELQQQRFGDKVKVSVNIDTKDDFFEIEPMLLIPFVENAFKHGVGLIENPEIDISLRTEDKDLVFFVQNKYNDVLPEQKDKASGIGLNNVQRRLNLLYKNHHTLSLTKRVTNAGENVFEVYLKINLHLMLRCIAIDDESLALSLLVDNISKVPYLQLVGTCSNALEATKLLSNTPVDLIFIDIQMPGISGMQFVQTLVQKPMVILITAYKQYALESYNLGVVDYLVKPVPLERFIAACNKAYEFFKLKNSNIDKNKPANWFFVNADYSLVKIMFSDVVWVEGLRDYVRIHLKSTNKPMVVRMSMKALEDELPAKDFIRFHKSYISSKEAISAVKKSSVFIGDVELPVGDTYREAMDELTGK